MLSKTIFITLTFFSTQALAGTSHYIDLSHNLSPETLVWPSSALFKVTHIIAETSPAGFYYSVREYSSNEHTGTHIDAPNHFAKGHASVDQIPLSQLIGSAIKVDVTKAVQQNHDYQIGIIDFKQWESKYGKIPADTIVLLSTGYGKYWPKWEKYSGTKKTGAASESDLHFPGLDPKAAEWLVRERSIKAIGIDAFSIDYGQTKIFKSHQLLTKLNIPIFENVACMEALPVHHFTIFAFPSKIKDGTGAPLRIVAEVHS